MRCVVLPMVFVWACAGQQQQTGAYATVSSFCAADQERRMSLMRNQEGPPAEAQESSFDALVEFCAQLLEYIKDEP